MFYCRIPNSVLSVYCNSRKWMNKHQRVVHIFLSYEHDLHIWVVVVQKFPIQNLNKFVCLEITFQCRCRLPLKRLLSHSSLPNLSSCPYSYFVLSKLLPQTLLVLNHWFESGTFLFCFSKLYTSADFVFVRTDWGWKAPFSTSSSLYCAGTMKASVAMSSLSTWKISLKGVFEKNYIVNKWSGFMTRSLCNFWLHFGSSFWLPGDNAREWI